MLDNIDYDNLPHICDSNYDQPRYPCPICKYDCDDDSCILCDFCTNWLHKNCANISDKRFRTLSLSQHIKYKCKFCKTRNKTCADCGANISHDRCEKLYCVTCKDWYCAQCLNLEPNILKSYLTTDKPYFCQDCNLDYFCPICKKICRDKCILCSKCENFFHTNCAKLTRSQVSHCSL